MSYGKEGYGVPPSLMDQYRSLAAHSVGGGGGKCATTLIACRLGHYQDPFILAARDQTKMWFYLVDQEQDWGRVSRAWWKCKGRILCEPRPWAKVRGPMGAARLEAARL